MQYLARRRLELAASLLNDGATVAAVARRVGYGSEAAFSRAFKRSTGITPSAWRGEDRTAQLDPTDLEQAADVNEKTAHRHGARLGGGVMLRPAVSTAGQFAYVSALELDSVGHGEAAAEGHEHEERVDDGQPGDVGDMRDWEQHGAQGEKR